MFSFYSALKDVHFAVWVSPVVQSRDCTHPSQSWERFVIGSDMCARGCGSCYVI